MGRSVTCTYSVHIQFEHSEVIYGAMNLKEAKGVLYSEMQYREEKHQAPPQGANVWAQTKTGEKALHGYDYLHISNTGEVTRKTIGPDEEI